MTDEKRRRSACYSALFLAAFFGAVGAFAAAFFAALGAAFFSAFGFTALGAASLSSGLGVLAAFFAAFLGRPPPPLATRSAIRPTAWSSVMESGAISFGMVALILPHFT